MKKWEKEILQKQNSDQVAVLKKLKKSYQIAISEIEDKIRVLQSKEQTQSVIYQKKYQQELLKQVKTVYGKMNFAWYTDTNQYLKDCYEDGFYQTMYSLHNEGIPLIFPFNQEEAVHAAAQTGDGIKLSRKLYGHVEDLAKTTRREITKGIAMNASFADIARAINKNGEATLNQAYRIARTESHRIHEEVKFKTINEATNKGADIVKQWDSTIDKRTRSSHVALDGQLREINQPFKSPKTGNTAMYPGSFGIALEDINCRCVVLQRARWALDKSELDKHVGDLDGMTQNQLDELAKKLGVSKDELIKKSNGVIESDGTINHRIKAQNYNQFKKKYQKKAETQKAKLDAKLEVAKKVSSAKWQTLDEAQNSVKKFSSDSERIVYHKNKNFSQEFWDNELSEKERESVQAYTGQHYIRMNRDLREDNISTSSKKRYIMGATSALEKFEVADDITVWRGMGSKNTLARNLNVSKEQLSQMVTDGSIVGQKFVEKGFCSAGVTEGAGWSKQVFMEIYVPKGTKGMYVDPISMHSGEHELILQRNTTFRIMKAERVDGKYKLYVSVAEQEI